MPGRRAHRTAPQATGPHPHLVLEARHSRRHVTSRRARAARATRERRGESRRAAHVHKTGPPSKLYIYRKKYVGIPIETRAHARAVCRPARPGPRSVCPPRLANAQPATQTDATRRHTHAAGAPHVRCTPPPRTTIMPHVRGDRYIRVGASQVSSFPRRDAR